MECRDHLMKLVKSESTENSPKEKLLCKITCSIKNYIFERWLRYNEDAYENPICDCAHNEHCSYYGGCYDIEDKNEKFQTEKLDDFMRQYRPYEQLIFAF